ncbi:hypothetical protein PHO31112_03149 [Pandoraea horticolens]|uniref:Uncharacterized protein n=1 Tax=Pandoraea horticolens TaxID=2508298 RepID=A0A5E4WDH3_9BURK|nr:hypothetical protein PHO31112_03149 [Pandoraea horticolens]
MTPRSTARETAAAETLRGSSNTRSREGSHAAFALGLLTVVCAAGVASAAIVPGAPVTSLRSMSRRSVSTDVPTVAAPAALTRSETLSGFYALLRVWPSDPGGQGVMAQCLPTHRMRSVGNPAISAHSNEALRAGLTTYRSDIQRAVVALIREAVATSDAQTRAAFANADILVPSHKSLIVEHTGTLGSTPTRVAYHASHAISLHLRDEVGTWREFALSLAYEAPALITPVAGCGPRNKFGQRCFGETYGPVFWGARWAAIESRIGENDEMRFTLKTAGASISPGWPSPESSVIDSPDMEEVAELLLDTLAKSSPRDRREAQDAFVGPRSRRDALADIGGTRALASRLSMTGLECLAAVVHADKLHQDAIALLQHLWPDAPVKAPREAVSHEPSLPPVIQHEPFSGPYGRGVAWSLPPDVYVEYLPDRAQNGVKVFQIDGDLYGASVARTRKHASDLRPLKDMRAELGPESLCRISRGVGADVDGMCLECHGEQEGEVSVTEQGATVTQHQVIEASPLVRLRVAVYSQAVSTSDGGLAFFAFGRLGHFDEEGAPRVSAQSPVVDSSLYASELNGELTYYEQASTDGPVGGRRVRLTLGNMPIAAPFGTYRDRHNTLHGVVQLSHDVYYRFTLPIGDAARSTHQVHLHYRQAEHRDIREYRTAQNHRAAAENAIVLPMISYGEARTLLQLYLKVWEDAPSPADVWRGLEDISLSVVEARRAIHTLTHAIEHRVAASRTPAASPGASGFSPPQEVDAALMPMFNRLWSRWQGYPAQAEAFINAISRDFVSRPAPLAVWSQLPFVGDVQTTRDVLSIFETLFPDMPNLQGLVTGSARAARDVGDQMREVSRNANIAVAEVTLVDGTRTIYYCMSGLQRRELRTSASNVRIVDAGRAYKQRQDNVINQRRKAPRTGTDLTFTEPPHLRYVMADADLPTYNAATRGAQARTLDTERMILAQIYADHPSGENVIRSIVMCSRLPFCDSCAVNLAMVPYHYPDAELRFYYVSPSPRDRQAPGSATSEAPSPASAAARPPGRTGDGTGRRRMTPRQQDA